MRKPTSVLETKLTEEQQAKLAELLLGGVEYAPAVEFCEKQFGIKSSISAMQRFWDSVCRPLLLVRRSRFSKAAQAIDTELKTSSGAFDAALVDALKQKAFEILVNPNADPQQIFFVISQALKVRDQDLKAQQVGLARDRFEFTASKACLQHLPTLKEISSDNSLGNDEKIQAVRRVLFGALPEDQPA